MRARLLACLALARLAAAPWITPCQHVLLKQLRVDKRANLAATECSERALHHASSFWLLVDRRRNVVLTGIPKAGITSIRSALNRKCFLKEGQRCAEFRKNLGLRRMNVSNALRAVMFREPYERALSMWRNLEELTRNGVVSNSFKTWGCTSPLNCSLARFVRVLANERIGVHDEHQASQYTIARPDLMKYHFAGLLGVKSDENALYKDILGTTPVHEHRSVHVEPNISHVAAARRTIEQIYKKDYEMLRDFGLL